MDGIPGLAIGEYPFLGDAIRIPNLPMGIP
jgi:hypothetical protein